MTLDVIVTLVTDACKPGPRQINCIVRLGEYLHSGKLSESLVEIVKSDVSDIDEVAKNIVSVPNRTVNALLLEQIRNSCQTGYTQVSIVASCSGTLPWPSE